MYLEPDWHRDTVLVKGIRSIRMEDCLGRYHDLKSLLCRRGNGHAQLCHYKGRDRSVLDRFSPSGMTKDLSGPRRRFVLDGGYVMGLEARAGSVSKLGAMSLSACSRTLGESGSN